MLNKHCACFVDYDLKLYFVKPDLYYLGCTLFIFYNLLWKCTVFFRSYVYFSSKHFCGGRDYNAMYLFKI